MVPAEVLPPDEQPDREYPFVLSTGRQLEHWHTGAMTRRATNLNALEPEATAQMNMADITRFGLQPGDPVRVTTRRGTITINVRADNNVPQGVIYVPFAYVEAAANLLTNPARSRSARSPSSSSAPPASNRQIGWRQQNRRAVPAGDVHAPRLAGPDVPRARTDSRAGLPLPSGAKTIPSDDHVTDAPDENLQDIWEHQGLLIQELNTWCENAAPVPLFRSNGVLSSFGTCAYFEALRPIVVMSNGCNEQS
jgi:formylmethanofuran dehydrogenase subunit D